MLVDAVELAGQAVLYAAVAMAWVVVIVFVIVQATFRALASVLAFVFDLAGTMVLLAALAALQVALSVRDVIARDDTYHK